jgi:diaminohydroxyphosphoribosylaminopyrimidine deaminase/5-amino-6-(5-phosphoribosylamino)uracil reductase
MNQHEHYMARCLELAKRAAGHVAPNPMVGAVLVHEHRILGEGFHQKYGGPHAEVNCIQEVSAENRELISKSMLYVSLEPCAHHGKTPPCADLILANGIPKVVIGCRDPFPLVNGKGIEKLVNGGVEVELGILETECVELNRRFFTFHRQHRPYIILKWAQSRDLKIANGDHSRVFISNELSNRLVHRWRSEESAILVGTNTAKFDNPLLSVRLWNGPQPIRLVVDLDLKLPSGLHLMDRRQRTIVFNTIQHEEDEMLSYYQVTTDTSLVHQILNALYHFKIQSVLVEGGAKLLQSFLDEGLWDEMRVITNESISIEHGLPAPDISSLSASGDYDMDSDHIAIYRNE